MSNVRLQEGNVQAPLGVVDRLLQAIQGLQDSHKQLQDQASKFSAKDQSIHRSDVNRLVDHLPTLPAPQTTLVTEGVQDDANTPKMTRKEALAKHLM